MANETLDHWQVEAICRGEHGNPFELLGAHERDGNIIIRAWLPHAGQATVVTPDGRPLGEMTLCDARGFFTLTLPAAKKPAAYRLCVDWYGNKITVDDPYRFLPVLTDDDIWLIGEGNHRQLWQVLGAHLRAVEGTGGVHFSVWAPNAKRVSVVGDFNHWDGSRYPMRLRRECGIWEIFLPGLALGERYKFEVLDWQSRAEQKSDPYGFAAELRPATASIVSECPAPVAPYPRDAALGSPVTIYEVHLSSWRRKPEENDRWLSYRELADTLIPYAVDMGFTHLEFLPISEHPFDGSWGYQPIGLYAPTSRFGSPDDFRFLVQAAHAAGLGVILDWVPGHFPSDAHGLARFDGSSLYEHADPREGLHIDWKTLIYNYGRREVANFLAANALFWLSCYGIDGLRVDAVASMLYRDYSRLPGEWVPNVHGGRENLEAIAFLQRMNHWVGVEQAGATTMAEESTSFPAVSRPPEHGGLGFHYKWNMGWMHDTLLYMARDPIHRPYHHNELTFSFAYAFSENYVLPLSHDEVVHGKGSLLSRMPGDDWQRFANLRVYYGYMWTHPGKKLLFMGGEFAQVNEWNHAASLDWHLLNDDRHAGVQRLVRDLNHLYRNTPALHRHDCDPAGFDAICYDDNQNSALAFVRRDGAGSIALVVCNFTPVVRHGYRVGVPNGGVWREIFNTDSAHYGGSNVGNGDAYSEPVHAHGKPQSVQLTLAPLATQVFLWEAQ